MGLGTEPVRPAEPVRHSADRQLAGCGNFDNGQVKLKTGTTATGCVTFQVPKGDKVAEVRYGNTVYPGITAQRHLP